MSKPKKAKPKEKRVRLSLETKEGVVRALRDHGVALGEWSAIGTIRRALARSEWLLALEKRGGLMSWDGMSEGDKVVPP